MDVCVGWSKTGGHRIPGWGRGGVQVLGYSIPGEVKFMRQVYVSGDQSFHYYIILTSTLKAHSHIFPANIVIALNHVLADTQSPTGSRLGPYPLPTHV